MTRYAACSLVALFAAGLGALAAPPDLVIPAEVKPAGGYARFTPKTNGVSVTYVGLSGVDAFPSDELKDARRFLLPTSGLKAGRYKFAAVAAGKTGEQTRQDFEVVVGDAPPVPPGPGPTPPGPQPPPEPPAPIPAAGLHVLIVYERMEASKLTREQHACIYGQEFYDYLNAKCPDGPGGKKTWRIWDKDAEAAGDEDPVWATAMKRERKSLPWIVVSDGKTGFEGELPKTKTEILSLIKKYGG